MLKNKRVFVSGGAGVIGKSLVEKLESLGAVVFVGDLKPRPLDFSKDIIYRRGDLNFITKQELADFNPEYFFHLAATFERAEETYEFWDENFKHNINLSHHLMTCLKDCKNLKRVIFASSYLIYDPKLYYSNTIPQNTHRLKESDAIYPRNTCGAAKLLHEIENRFLEGFEQTNFTSVSARIFRVYGKNSRDIISRWIRTLLDDEIIFVYNQDNRFDYIYSEDVAEGLIQLAINPISGVINLGRDNSRSIKEVYDILKSYFPNMKIKFIESKPPFESSQANMEKFQELTNWHPSIQLEEAIPRIIQFEKNNRFEKNLKESNKNILVTSISRKVPLLMSLKEANTKLNNLGKIIGADLDNNCIGKFFTDNFWNSPPMDRISLEEILEYCKENHVSSIIPTRDGELIFFAKNKKEFQDNGIHVMISEEDAVQSCLDKIKFYEKGKQNKFPVIKTSKNIGDIDAIRYVVKERFGAGSKKIKTDLTKEEAIAHSKTLNEPIFQPFVIGKEYSVDLYVDMKKKSKGAIARTRDVIINGESQISETKNYPELEEICCRFAEMLNLYGHSVFQVLVDSNNKFNIIECNNRFGGASSLSQKMGLDSFYWFLLESLGENLENYYFTRSDNNKKQIRFPSDLVL